MGNNTHDRTEDMVDQTFDVDNEITNATQFTEEHTQVKEGPVNPKVKAKASSSNTIIFIAMGVAAVGFVGYEFVLPMFMGNHPQQNNVSKINPSKVSPASQIGQNNNTNLPNKNIVNSSENMPANNSSLQNSSSNNVNISNNNSNQVNLNGPAASFLDGNKNGNSAPNVAANNNPQPTSNTQDAQSSSSIQTNENNSSLALSNNATKPVKENNPTNSSGLNNVDKNTTLTTVNQADANPNDQQINVVDHLQKMFDEQNQSFKNSLTDLDSRVSALEDANKNQQKINQDFNQRISHLEEINHIKSEKLMSFQKDDHKVVEEKHKEYVKHVVKHYHYVKPSMKKEEHVQHSDILINKRNIEAPKKVEKETKEVTDLKPLKIYSIYSGRVWVKNSNGTLSTYTAGDRLPTGEIIKKVDNDKLEIITNMRTISE
jgi:hypothetical protein